MRKYTKWFKGSVCPPAVGLWQRRMFPGREPIYAWWNGKFWSIGDVWEDVAVRNRRSASTAQHTPMWRGLASDPNENLGQAVARIRNAVAAKGGYGEGA